MDTEGSQRRTAPRAALHYKCTLMRRRGAPVVCTTLDVGPGGMRVTAERPLTIDEVVFFELPLEQTPCNGRARVLREQGFQIYALRFESIPDGAARLLGTLVQQAA